MCSREVPRFIGYAEGTLRERMSVEMKGVRVASRNEKRIDDYSRAAQRAVFED